MNGEQITERIKILRILFGVLAGLTVMVISNIVFSALTLKELLPQESMSVYAFVATSLGAAVSGIISSHNNKVVLYALISALLYFCIRWILGTMLYSESMQWGLIVSLALSFVFSFLGAMLGTTLRHK